MAITKSKNVEKQDLKNKLLLLELFIKELKDEYLPEIKRVDYEKLVQYVDKNEVSKQSNGNTMEKSFSKSINDLTHAIINTTQFNNKQLKAFSMLKPIEKLFKESIIEFEVHLKDINRKNASEIIKFADKITRPLRLISLSDLALDNIDLFSDDKKKKGFLGKERKRY